MNTSPAPDIPDPDSPVGDDILVYRLVPTWSCDVVDGEWEFQSGAFDNATPESPEDSPDDMSVVIGDHLAALHRTPEALPDDTIWADERYGVAKLEVHYLRNEEAQDVLRTPKDEEPAHGDVRGKKNPKRRRRLKAHAVWVIRPALPPKPQGS